MFCNSAHLHIKYLESKPQYWHTRPAVWVKEIENVNKMKMALSVLHTMNHQNFFERNNRRSELVFELNKIFESLGIKYNLVPPRGPSHSTSYGRGKNTCTNFNAYRILIEKCDNNWKLTLGNEFSLTNEQETWVVGIMLSVTLAKLVLVVYCCSFTNEIVKAYAQDHYFDVITNVIGLVAALLANYFKY